MPIRFHEEDFLYKYWRGRDRVQVIEMQEVWNKQVHPDMILWTKEDAESEKMSVYRSTGAQPRTGPVSDDMVKNYHFTGPKPIDFILGWAAINLPLKGHPLPAASSSSDTHKQVVRTVDPRGGHMIKRGAHASEKKVGTTSKARPVKKPDTVIEISDDDMDTEWLRAMTEPGVLTFGEGPEDPIRVSMNAMCYKALNAWIDAASDNVWPNIVAAVHTDIALRARAWEKTTPVCRLCKMDYYESAGCMHHNLLSCRMIRDDPKLWHSTSWAVWDQLQDFPFRLPRSEVKMQEVMTYYGTLLGLWQQRTDDVYGEIQEVNTHDMLLASSGGARTAEEKHMKEYKATEERSRQREDNFMDADGMPYDGMPLGC